MYVDVHAHLDLEDFSDDIDTVISRAINAGVTKIIVNAVDTNSFALICTLREKYDCIDIALGLYPDTVRDMTQDEFDSAIKQIIKLRKDIVAIGEIGLDYKYTTDSVLKEKQKKGFLAQIELAKKWNIPVIVHSRDAEEDCINLLIESGHKKVLMHCFSGSVELAQKGVKAGFFYSIPVRAVSSRSFQKLVDAIPISRILTETDAPYLHYKNERNEPANVVLTVKKIAEIKKTDEVETKKAIFSNYLRLFSA